MVKDKLLELFADKAVVSDGSAAKTIESDALEIDGGNSKLALIFMVKEALTVSGSGDITITVKTADYANMVGAETLHTKTSLMANAGEEIIKLIDLKLKKFVKVEISIASGRVVTAGKVDCFLTTSWDNNWKDLPAPQCADVVLPESTTFNSSMSVTMTCATEGATIKYTDDGSTPTSASTTYSSAITVSATKTIKAIAIKTGYADSAVTSATYTKN